MSHRGSLISIIMNCYNGEQYLRETVESVLAQTYPNWELIFWDNQSTDKSAEIIRSYNEPRIKYFYAPTHTDLGKARRQAAEKASGDWLAFLDCDDLWLPEKLQIQMNLIQEEHEQGNFSLGLVYGRAIRFGNKPIAEPEFPFYFKGKSLPEGSILKDLLFQQNFISSTNVMVLRDAYQKVEGFPEDYKYAPDYYLSCAIAKLYTVRATSEFISKYRMHDNNLSSKMGNIAFYEVIRILKQYLHDYPDAQKRINEIRWGMFKKRILDGLEILGMKDTVKHIQNNSLTVLKKIRRVF